MKKILIATVLLTGLVSCNNEGSDTEKKLDTLSQKIDTTLEKVWDSTKAKANDIKEKIEEKWDKRDSLKKDSTHTDSTHKK